LVGLSCAEAFGMGTTNDFFQQLGKQLFSMEMLNSSVSDGAILTAVPLSIQIEIPSGPLALEASSDCISVRTRPVAISARVLI